MQQLSKPLMLVNFKTYPEATGIRALSMSQACEKTSKESRLAIAVAPQACDIAAVAASVSIPVFAQHIDSMPPGSFTGHVIAETVKAAGARGTIINHSEYRRSLDAIKTTVARAKEVGLISVVCGDTPEMCNMVTKYKPDFVAIEPPELVGSGIAVSKAQPEIVTKAIQAIKSENERVHVLCGAGISRGADASAALDLGAEGILVASAVVKASDPSRILSEMAEAMSSHH